MEEITDIEALKQTYTRMNDLVNSAAKENDIRLREYTHEIYMHSVRKVEPESTKRRNTPAKFVASLIDNDDGLSTAKLVEELQGVAAKEYEPIELEVKGINDEDMQRNHMIFMSLVERAKRDGHKRIDRLKESYEQVTAHQKQIMRQAMDDYKQHRGFHRLKNRILELENQLSKQKTLLAERKFQYELRKAESTQSAEELRSKYEYETEELIRTLLITIETKQIELDSLQERHEDIRRDIDRICKDLSLVLHDIEKEEKAKLGKRHGRRTHMNSKTKDLSTMVNKLEDSDAEGNPVDPASKNNNSNQPKKDSDEVTIIDVFPFIKVGELNDEMIQMTYKMVDESSAILQSKQAEKEYAEQKLAMKKNELTAILKSEESKALERLKKMVLGLEVKIDSDEKRAGLLDSLVKNLEHDTKAGGVKPANRGGFGSAANKTVAGDNNNNKNAIANRRSHNLAYAGKNSRDAAAEADTTKATATFNDEDSQSEEDEHEADDEDDVDTGGNPADIERIRLKKLEKEAKKRMEELKKAKLNGNPAATVASDGSSNLSFDTNDSSKFQALQAKFLRSTPVARYPQDLTNHEITLGNSNNNNTKRSSSPLKIGNGKAGTVEGDESAVVTSNVSQRFIAPSQVSKILQTMDIFEQYIRPPVWALGPSNVLIPYSQRPVGSAANNNPANSTNTTTNVAAVNAGNSGPVPPSMPRTKTPTMANPSRLMIEAHAIEGVGGGGSQFDYQRPVPRTLTQRLEDQMLAPTKEDRDKLMSREEKAKLAEEKQQQDYFMQSYGFHLALDQLQMLMELLTHWGATAPEQTTLDNLKEALSPSKGATNIMLGVMKVRTEEEELEDLERMRHQTQEVLLSLKQAYRQNKSLHQVLKDTSRAVHSEVRRCDDVKHKLFAEIQGLRWEQHLQPGQYQQEMKMLKEKIQSLKGELRLWETKIRQQSKSNSRMSQALTDETTARKISEGIADKLRQQQVLQKKQQIGQSSLSSITGRPLLNTNANNNTNNSPNKRAEKFAPTLSSVLSGERRRNTPGDDFHNTRSQASMSLGVSAASSSILDELSDLDDTFDFQWPSAGGSTETAKKPSASKRNSSIGGSSIASVSEEESVSSTKQTAKKRRASNKKKANKASKDKKTTEEEEEGNSDNMVDVKDSVVAEAKPLRGSLALEEDDHRSLMHDIMTMPNKQRQSIQRRQNLTPSHLLRTPIVDTNEDSDNGRGSNTNSNNNQRNRRSDNNNNRNAASQDAFPEDDEKMEKMKLYHDATDIYAQAMRDLSESQKQSR